MKKSKVEGNDIYEMSRNTIEDLCQTNVDTLKEIIDIELNYMNLCQEYLNAQMDRISSVKSPQDLISIESGIATEYANKFSETNRRLYETVSSAMEKQMQCLNLPADVENLLPDFQTFENMLTPTAKKAAPAKRTSS